MKWKSKIVKLYLYNFLCRIIPCACSFSFSLPPACHWKAESWKRTLTSWGSVPLTVLTFHDLLYSVSFVLIRSRRFSLQLCFARYASLRQTSYLCKSLMLNWVRKVGCCRRRKSCWKKMLSAGKPGLRWGMHVFKDDVENQKPNTNQQKIQTTAIKLKHKTPNKQKTQNKDQKKVLNFLKNNSKLRNVF